MKVKVVAVANGGNMRSDGSKIIVQNRKAHHDYFIEETYEAGIALFGTEVKSVRAGQVNLKDSYCQITDGELFVNLMHISPYEKGNIFNRDPLRSRKLLMHKKEILKLLGLTQRDGYTLIPLDMHFSKANVKILIGLCRGKKNYDKRAASAVMQANREMERYSKNKLQYTE